MDEISIRLHERARTLRKVLAELTRIEDNPTIDPYMWGYGTSKVREAVELMLKQTEAELAYGE